MSTSILAAHTAFHPNAVLAAGGAPAGGPAGPRVRRRVSSFSRSHRIPLTSKFGASFSFRVYNGTLSL